MTATFLTSPPGWEADPRRPHLVLVGLPGAGKSVVGAMVAEQLGRAFLDLDREIERREGASITALFGERGEEYFRRKERDLTEELSRLGNMVLSPGGGWIANADVVALLRSRSRIIYLRVRPEIAIKRLGPERATRPLLMRPDPLGEMKKLLAAREAAYKTADHTIDTDHLSIQQVTKKVAELATSLGAT